MGTVETNLYNAALKHEGLFTSAEACQAGVSPHALLQAERRGRVVRVSRGIYRLVNFPVLEERAQLWEAVLWPTTRRGASAELGVLSHLTALFLNYAELDYIPTRVTITISPKLRIRKGRPSWLDVYKAELLKHEVSYSGSGLPVTTLDRTLRDCLEASVDNRLIKQVFMAALAEPNYAKLSSSTIARIRTALG